MIRRLAPALVVCGALVWAAPASAGTASVAIGARGHTAFRVPQGVTSLQVTLTGERGAAAPLYSRPGGPGAVAVGTRAVAAGEIYDFAVGVGGGSAGGISVHGGTGGGATEMRFCGAATCPDLAARLLVAGGGGGAGGGLFGGTGGAAGTTGNAGNGAAGPAGPGSGGVGGAGGAGATTAAPGSGGAGGDGAAGQGGAGGSTTLVGNGGGGGGGGWFGGEGGGAGSGATDSGGGGGGGTSHATAGITNASFAQAATGAPSALIVYDDPTAPAPSVQQPGDPLADRTPAFAGTAGIDTGDAAVVRLAAYAGSATTGTPAATGAGTVDSRTGDWTGALAAPLPDGDYTLVVTQGDAGGNSGTATVPFSVDATGPVISLTAPAAGATYAFGAAVTAAFACTDPSGVASCTGTRAAGATLGTRASGAQRFTVVAVDALGNVASKTVDYTVGDPPPAVTPTPLDRARLHVIKVKVHRHRVTVSGTVAGDAAGRVVVTARRGKTVRRAKARIAHGRFAAHLKLPRAGRWRLTIAYAGDTTHRAAKVTRRVSVRP